MDFLLQVAIELDLLYRCWKSERIGREPSSFYVYICYMKKKIITIDTNYALGAPFC